MADYLSCFVVGQGEEEDRERDGYGAGREGEEVQYDEGSVGQRDAGSETTDIQNTGNHRENKNVHHTRSVIFVCLLQSYKINISHTQNCLGMTVKTKAYTTPGQFIIIFCLLKSYQQET